MPEQTRRPARQDQSTGRELLLALTRVGRYLRQRTDGHLDTASVIVLHQVLLSDTPRLSDLAKCLRLDGSTVSRHVRQLEDDGFLTRKPDPDDRRAARVALTERGRALLEESLTAKAVLVDRAMAEWAPEDRAAFAALATRLAESVERLLARTETG